MEPIFFLLAAFNIVAAIFSEKHSIRYLTWANTMFLIMLLGR